MTHFDVLSYWHSTRVGTFKYEIHYFFGVYTLFIYFFNAVGENPTINFDKN
jgi:hypothetical protein